MSVEDAVPRRHPQESIASTADKATDNVTSMTDEVGPCRVPVDKSMDKVVSAVDESLVTETASTTD